MNITRIALPGRIDAKDSQVSCEPHWLGNAKNHRDPSHAMAIVGEFAAHRFIANHHSRQIKTTALRPHHR